MTAVLLIIGGAAVSFLVGAKYGRDAEQQVIATIVSSYKEDEAKALAAVKGWVAKYL